MIAAMERGRTLLWTLVLLGVSCRMLSLPIYHGATIEPVPSRWNAFSAPFADDLHGSCDSFLSLLARSLVREGLLATGGIPLFNLSRSAPEEFRYYDHHPPLVPLVTALAFKVFGDRESTSRGVALLFAALLTAFVLHALRPLGGVALLAAALPASLLPIGMYWGTHLNFEIPTMCLAGLAVCLALRTEPGTGHLRLAQAALILASLMDVLALFAALSIALEHAARGRFRIAVRFLLTGAAGLGIWLLWKNMQIARHGMSFGGRLLQHLKEVSFLTWFTSSPACGFGEWLLAMAGHLWSLFAGWPVLLLVLEIALLPVRSARLAGPSAALFRAFLWLALCAVLVPAVRSFDHPYYSLYFWMPAMVAFARLAVRLRALPGRQGAVATALVLVGAGAAGLSAEWLHPRPSATSSQPSAHRLGQELLASRPEPRSIVVIEPSPKTRFDLVTVAYYFRGLVTTLDRESPASQARFLDLLHAYGLELDHWSVWLALDPDWPGRGGWNRLHPPP